MAKLNRGKTAKLSIRLSPEARQKMNQLADNLGISTGGVMLFELTKLLKNFPPKETILALENEITLERAHFVATVNESFMERINNLSKDYKMNKNILIGYVISDHFQNMDLEETEEYDKPVKLMIQVNENLKKKMMEYSEEYFIPLNGLVTYAILQGPYLELPNYDEGDTVQIYTQVPPYIRELVKDQAALLNIREHFYTSLCIYKQFMLPEGRFY